VSTHPLRDIVGRFSQFRVLVVGDPILDEYVIGDCTRLSPEAPIPVLKVHETRTVLGGAANTAANVAALGGAVTLVAAAGPDEAGRRLAELAGQRGITCAFVPDVRPTSRKVRALGGQQQLLRLDYETELTAPAAVEAATIDAVSRHLDGMSAVVVSDYAKGLVGETVCKSVIRLAHGRSIPIVIDPRPQHADRYVGCDYLTPNWKEALGLLGDPERPATPEAADDVGRRLAARFGANILLTLGAQGIRYFPRDGGAVIEESAQAREVFDVSGAGDTVVAAFALSLAAGADIRSALRLANLAASVVVAKVGTATVSADELTRQAGDDGRLVQAHRVERFVWDLRQRGRKVAAVTGGFGTLHAGHVQLMRSARRRADVVVVGVDRTDAAADPDRIDMLLGLRDVDFVCVIDGAEAFIEALRPDVHVDASLSSSQRSTVDD
jgi:D-beta-D-heptose 7-phosphate kinase/D-beta-D-heptose 1-phosphate adenosyltransferase